MAFGAFSSMNVVIKNNKNLLLKRDRFKGIVGNKSSGKKLEYNFPEAKPHVLKRIKARLIEERKQRTKKRVIVLITFTIIVVSFLRLALLELTKFLM